MSEPPESESGGAGRPADVARGDGYIAVRTVVCGAAAIWLATAVMRLLADVEKAAIVVFVVTVVIAVGGVCARATGWGQQRPKVARMSLSPSPIAGLGFRRTNCRTSSTASSEGSRPRCWLCPEQA